MMCSTVVSTSASEGYTRRLEGRAPSSGRHAQDRLDGPAGFGVLDRLVDLVEIVVRHQLLEREAALALQLHQPWNEDLRHAASLHDADDRL